MEDSTYVPPLSKDIADFRMDNHGTSDVQSYKVHWFRSTVFQVFVVGGL
jgi:hypothetical protein